MSVVTAMQELPKFQPRKVAAYSPEPSPNPYNCQPMASFPDDRNKKRCLQCNRRIDISDNFCKFCGYCYLPSNKKRLLEDVIDKYKPDKVTEIHE